MPVLRLDSSRTHRTEISPIEQTPETVAFGAMGGLYTLAFLANTAVAFNEGIGDGVGTDVATTGFMAGFFLQAMASSYKETVAFNNATEDERNAPELLRKRLVIRRLRTLGWFATSSLSGYLSLKGVIDVAESTGPIDALKGTLQAGVGAAVTKWSVMNSSRSIGEHREIRDTLDAYRAENPREEKSYVSQDYHMQLQGLSRTLVNPQRFSASSD